MYYQQALKPRELLYALSSVGECFFLVHAQLPERQYQIAIYRYDHQYFILNDPRLFEQIRTIVGEIRGDEEEILPYIEEALEENYYYLVEEDFVKLDLQTLQKMKPQEFKILFYEFFDNE